MQGIQEKVRFSSLGQSAPKFTLEWNQNQASLRYTREKNSRFESMKGQDVVVDKCTTNCPHRVSYIRVSKNVQCGL